VFNFGRRDDFRTGYVAGGGIEYAFTPNLTGRVEAQYVSLDRAQTQTFIGASLATRCSSPITVVARTTTSSWVRAGVSYKFNLF
jgi:outer membrane immunogenic protein